MKLCSNILTLFELEKMPGSAIKLIIKVLFFCFCFMIHIMRLKNDNENKQKELINQLWTLIDGYQLYLNLKLY